MRQCTLIVLLLAFVWETIEHYLETQAPAPVVAWFAGVEFWGNRLIADPLCVLAGAWLVWRYPRLTWPARAFSAFWLGMHVLVFPDSMYLHRFLPEWPPLFGQKTASLFDVWSLEHIVMGVGLGTLASWLENKNPRG